MAELEIIDVQRCCFCTKSARAGTATFPFAVASLDTRAEACWYRAFENQYKTDAALHVCHRHASQERERRVRFWMQQLDSRAFECARKAMHLDKPEDESLLQATRTRLLNRYAQQAVEKEEEEKAAKAATTVRATTVLKTKGETRQSASPSSVSLETKRRVSCHSCKQTLSESSIIYFCHSNAKKRACCKKFCQSCLARNYPELAGQAASSEWQCPSCLGLCGCKPCTGRSVIDQNNKKRKVEQQAPRVLPDEKMAVVASSPQPFKLRIVLDEGSATMPPVPVPVPALHLDSPLRSCVGSPLPELEFLSEQSTPFDSDTDRSTSTSPSWETGSSDVSHLIAPSPPEKVPLHMFLDPYGTGNLSGDSKQYFLLPSLSDCVPDWHIFGR